MFNNIDLLLKEFSLNKNANLEYFITKFQKGNKIPLFTLNAAIITFEKNLNFYKNIFIKDDISTTKNINKTPDIALKLESSFTAMISSINDVNHFNTTLLQFLYLYQERKNSNLQKNIYTITSNFDDLIKLCTLKDEHIVLLSKYNKLRNIILSSPNEILINHINQSITRELYQLIKTLQQVIYEIISDKEFISFILNIYIYCKKTESEIMKVNNIENQKNQIKKEEKVLESIMSSQPQHKSLLLDISIFEKAGFNEELFLDFISENISKYKIKNVDLVYSAQTYYSITKQFLENLEPVIGSYTNLNLHVNGISNLIIHSKLDTIISNNPAIDFSKIDFTNSNHKNIEYFMIYNNGVLKPLSKKKGK